MVQILEVSTTRCIIAVQRVLVEVVGVLSVAADDVL